MTTTIVRPVVDERERSSVRRTIADEFLTFFAFVLGGYAIGSKGFSYLGVPPLYIGEISMLFGLVATRFTNAPRLLIRHPVIRLLLVFMSFGALRTIPFLGEYGLNALRDAVLWGYGLFSIIVASLVISRPVRFSSLLSRYERFVPIFLIAAPVAWLGTIAIAQLARNAGVSVPTWPGTTVPLLHVKAGDLLVHLGGVGTFMCVGLAGESRSWRNWLLIVGVGLTGMSRGGLLAFSSAYAVGLAARPRSRGGWQVAMIVALAIAALAITGLRIRFPGNDREVSFQQLVTHVQSAAGVRASGTNAQDLENTKEWRLAWWAVIVNYTIGGDYRWGGKGYGVNLATDDGFQTSDDESTRSPHSAHMTVLARSGVIGLILWLCLQGTWLAHMVRTMRDARRQEKRHWHAVFAFLVAYWLALLVNGSFDVYLEGPAGGIWFWSIFGLGVAAEMLYRSGEPVLRPAASVPTS